MRELKAFSLLLGSGVLAQGLMFGGNLVLARLYQPETFGQLGYCAGFASLVAVVSGLRFDYFAFARAPEVRAVHGAVALVVASILHAGMLLALTGAVSLGLLAAKTAAWLLLFSACTSLYHLATQLMMANAAYEGFARARLVQAVVQVLLGVALAPAHIESGLLWAFSLSQLLPAGWLLVRHRNKYLRFDRRALRSCWRTEWAPAAANAVLVLMQYSTPFAPLLVGRLRFAADEVGAYFLFASAFAAPLAIFRRSAINLLNAEAASPERAKTLAYGVQQHFGRTLALLAVLSFAAVCALALGAADIARLVFGQRWTPHAALMLPIFAFHLIDAVLQPFTTLLPLWGHQRLALHYETARFLLVFVAWPVLTGLLALSFVNAVVLYFVLMIGVYVANFATVWFFVHAARPAQTT